MSYVIPTPFPTVVPIIDSNDTFPVRRVYCIGRNYADHAIEMGHDPEKEPPFFFQKNPDNINPTGNFPYPSQSQDVHYEVELVVALKSGGVDISPDKAMEHIYGYAIGLDMTRRDLQAHMKKMGRPWEIGKAFEQSAPIGPLHPVETVGNLSSGSIALTVNGEPKQQGDLNQMIWKIPEMIAYLSQYYELAAGDLIMTGTPAGVGSIHVGDVMFATIEGLGTLEVQVI
ncbi:FAA hydrolase family protein [Marinomonas agarivorans]|nr:FAA hydrolase family protein [Marinomonas agarivorans]